jgi:hypothetical protein
MYEPTEEQISPHVDGILTEVGLTQPLSQRIFSCICKQQRRWWNEERLAMLALGLGNACFFGLVIWWLW